MSIQNATERVKDDLQIESIPESERLVSHEFGNNLQIRLVSPKHPEKTDELMPDYEDSQYSPDLAISSLKELKGGKESGYVDENYEEFSSPEEALDTMVEDEDIPEYPRRVMFEGRNIIKAAESLEEKKNKRFTKDDVSLDYLLSAFGNGVEELYQDLNIDVDYDSDKDIQVRGGDELWASMHTLKKNWIDHGQGLEDFSELDVEVEVYDDQVELDIYDNGPGIEDDEREEIFEYGVGENTGLGLGLIDTLTELYEGSVEYSPENAEKLGGMGYEITLQRSS